MYRKSIAMLIALTFLMAGCSGKNCQADNLMIDLVSNDRKTTMRDSGPLAEYSKNSNLRMIYTASGEIDMKHLVSIENYSWSAKLTYDEKSSTFFQTDQYRGPWLIPEEVTFRSSTADQYYIACGKFIIDNSYNCTMIARYGNIFSFLSARITNVGTTFEEYQELLQMADRKITDCMDD